MRKSDLDELSRHLRRDLSTCTHDEMQERWGSGDRAAAEEVCGVPWAAIVPGPHNPIYYLAEKVWFDRVLSDPAFLYAPYHRDRLCGPIMDYVLASEQPRSGFLFLGPRDSYKTTFAHGAIPMWYVLRAKHLEKRDARIILRHHKEEMASRNLLRARAKYIAHPWLREVWPDACPATSATRSFGNSTEITLPWVVPGEVTEPSFYAVGIGAATTGGHYDLDMGDDLVTAEHTTSKQIRDDAKFRYQSKRYEMDTQRGREVNTGTPYHKADLWAQMIQANVENEPIYRTVIVPAINDDDSLNLPFKLTRKFLDTRMQEEMSRSGNADQWYLQYQCAYNLTRAVATEEWWLRECSASDVPPDAMPVIVVDCAWKGDQNFSEGDSASVQAWYMVRRGASVLRYLRDGVHSNEMTSFDGEREILRLMHKYRVRLVAPEEHGGYTFRRQIQHAAASVGLPIQIVDLKTKQTKKDTRITTFLREAEAGNVLVCKEADPNLLEAFRSQFRDWPQTKDDHDDALDAAAYTCDPNITQAWVPPWDVAAQAGPWRPGRGLPQASEYVPRTRYCSL